MDVNKEFGECLRLLLSSTHISNKMLAKVLNIDPSLVSRWIHGTRIPPYYSHYIDAIAEYLSKNILTSFQEKKVKDLIQELYSMDINNNSLSTKNLIKKFLLEAQAFSMNAKAKLKPLEEKSSPSKKSSAAKENTNPPKTEHPTNLQSIEQNYAYPSESVPIDQDMPIPLSSQDTLLIGHHQIFTRILDLLKAAASSSCDTKQPIILTFTSALACIPYDDAYYPLFKKNIHQAISRGWKIIFLIRLNHHLDAIINFIEDMQLYCFEGNVSFYYLKKYDPSLIGNDIIIVPNLGALLCLVTSKEAPVNNAFYFKNPSAVTILRKCFDQSMTSAAPLIKAYLNKTDLALLRRFTEFEEQTGNQYLYTCSLNSSMIPPDLFDNYMKRKEPNLEERNLAIQYQQRRQSTFLWQINHYSYKDICIKEHIEQMVHTHQYPFGEVYGIGKLITTPYDIKTHLENIVYHLESFDHYEMALISQKQIGFPLHLSWAVKENHSVIHKFYTDKNCYKVNSTQTTCHRDLLIDELMTVHGFKEKHLNLWEEIPPLYKNKKDVLQWLKVQIQILSKICNG
ncbi:helix-turn-helix transcriptional regulator [Clostridiaceae bacterium 35-E11]